MNFLVHCWLGRGEPGLQAGGFLGDFIKGSLDSKVPLNLKRGLLLHRYIDVQSNRLPSMRNTYHRFGTELRRPAPILLDLMADHVFAKYWDEFSVDMELCKFTQNCYQAIEQFDIPTAAQRFFIHMRDTDLLARYAQIDVVEDIMVRILKRLRYNAHAAELVRRLRAQEAGFREDFALYFWELQDIAELWLTKERDL